MSNLQNTKNKPNNSKEAYMANNSQVLKALSKSIQSRAKENESIINKELLQSLKMQVLDMQDKLDALTEHIEKGTKHVAQLREAIRQLELAKAKEYER